VRGGGQVGCGVCVRGIAMNICHVAGLRKLDAGETLSDLLRRFSSSLPARLAEGIGPKRLPLAA